MKELISVIIPTYGRNTTFLSRSLNSVLIQTYKPLEIIVVNDNDKESAEYLEIKSYCETIYNIIYLETNHIGSCLARNYAVNKSTGKYIAFLDDDDAWLPQKLEVQIQYFTSNVGLVFSNGYWVHTNIQPIKKESYRTSENFKKEVFFNDLLIKNYVGTTSQIIVLKKAFMECGGFNKDFIARHDYDLCLRISQKYRIVGAPDYLFEHYIHGGEQIIMDNKKSLIGYQLLYKTYKKFYNKNRIAKSNISYKISQAAFNEKNIFLGIKYMILAIVYHPSERKQLVKKIFSGKTF